MCWRADGRLLVYPGERFGERFPQDSQRPGRGTHTALTGPTGSSDKPQTKRACPKDLSE